MNTKVVKKSTEVQGHSSRKKLLIIEEAMARCATQDDMFNLSRIYNKFSENFFKNFKI